jgi:hypothetical protein
MRSLLPPYSVQRISVNQEPVGCRQVNSPKLSESAYEYPQTPHILAERGIEGSYGVANRAELSHIGIAETYRVRYRQRNWPGQWRLYLSTGLSDPYCDP